DSRTAADGAMLRLNMTRRPVRSDPATILTGHHRRMTQSAGTRATRRRKTAITFSQATAQGDAEKSVNGTYEEQIYAAVGNEASRSSKLGNCGADRARNDAGRYRLAGTARKCRGQNRADCRGGRRSTSSDDQ